MVAARHRPFDPPVAGQSPAVVAELAKDREVLRFEPD
jgi:hypothetical protein